MRIIIAPAKKMNVDTDSFSALSVPHFIAEAEQLKTQLQSMSVTELQALWKCNDNIANLNIARLRDMELQTNLTPAIFSYEGIQYKCMAPNVFERSHFDYITKHLRILSGFYGVLRPFDGVTPYRLEMQAKLAVNEHKGLYAYWGDKLAKHLESECSTVLNLASKEYSEAIRPHLLPTTKFITCVFGERINGKVVEKGTMCKMARGYMVRYMAENNIQDINDIKQFNEQGYTYSESDSTDINYVFIR